MKANSIQSHATCASIDIQGENPFTKEKKRKYYPVEKGVLPPTNLTATSVVQRHSPQRLGEGRRQDLGEEYEAGGDAAEAIGKSIEKTTICEHSLSFTKAWSAGVSLGVSYYVDLGFDFNISHSKTTTATQSTQEKITRDRKLELEAGKRYKITEEVFEVEYQEDVDLNIILSGHVAVFFSKRIALTANEGKHKMQLVPITTIVSDLQKAGKWPQTLQCTIDLNPNKVTLHTTGQHKYKMYHSKMNSQIISDTNTHKQQTSQTSNVIPSSTSSLPHQAGTFDYSPVVGEIGVHFEDVSPEDFNQLKPKTLATMIDEGKTPAPEVIAASHKDFKTVHDAHPSLKDKRVLDAVKGGATVTVAHRMERTGVKINFANAINKVGMLSEQSAVAVVEEEKKLDAPTQGDDKPPTPM